MVTVHVQAFRRGRRFVSTVTHGAEPSEYPLTRLALWKFGLTATRGMESSKAPHIVMNEACNRRQRSIKGGSFRIPPTDWHLCL
ncbi:hypothetical protein PM082_020861 [Marasmius tenuissimus]|nr:hypothetical protein PM082_020861 [Marasmius tenuissimus]